MAGDIFSGWNSVMHAPVAAPPSDVPVIASLGNMIDAMSMRQMEMARLQRQWNTDELASQREADKQAYYMRKLDLQEGKQDNADAFSRAKYNQGLQQEIAKKVAKGEHPGSYVFMGEDGRPVHVTPRFVPYEERTEKLPDPFENYQGLRGEPDPFESMQAPISTPPQQPGAPEPSGMDATGLVMPASLTTRIPEPIANAAAANPDADSLDELGLGERDPDPAGTAALERRLRAQSGDPGGTIDLRKPIPPMDDVDSPSEAGLDQMSSDPAADREYERRLRERSGDQGGKIDLRAPVQPMAPDPDPAGTDQLRLKMQVDDQTSGFMPKEEAGRFLDQVGVPPLPERRSNDNVPGSENAMLAAMSDRRGELSGEPAPTPSTPTGRGRGKWVYEVPGVGPVEIDLEEASRAHAEEVRNRIAQIDAAMAEPDFAMDPVTIREMRRQKAMLMADMPQAERLAMGKSVAARDNLDLQEQGKTERLDKTLASQEKRSSERNANALAIAAMRGKKRIAQSDRSVASGGTAYSRLGQKMANQTRRAVDMSMDRDMRHMNWDKLIGVGFDRLNLANLNASATGPFAGSQHMESMMNFFGYIRGGVPALNETREWRRISGNLFTTLDEIGAYFGHQGLGQQLRNGDTAGEDGFEDINSRMSQEQRASLLRAIKESTRFISSTGEKDLDAMAQKFSEASTLPERELAQARLNTMRRFIGMEPKQFFQDVKLGGGQTAEPAQVGGEAPSSGKPSIRDLLLGGS